MTYPQTLRRIILPEAFEVALPTLGNSFISIIKGTSLAFTCAVVEITAQGQIIGGRSIATLKFTFHWPSFTGW